MTQEIKELNPNISEQAILEVFKGMTLQQKREWIIKMKIAKQKLTIITIANRHKLSAYYLGACISGKFALSAKVIKALEDDLSLDLNPFLTDKERLKKADK